jgi:hypothetical protein
LVGGAERAGRDALGGGGRYSAVWLGETVDAGVLPYPRGGFVGGAVGLGVGATEREGPADFDGSIERDGRADFDGSIERCAVGAGAGLTAPPPCDSRWCDG